MIFKYFELYIPYMNTISSIFESVGMNYFYNSKQTHGGNKMRVKKRVLNEALKVLGKVVSQPPPAKKHSTSKYCKIGSGADTKF